MDVYYECPMCDHTWPAKDEDIVSWDDICPKCKKYSGYTLRIKNEPR